MCLLLGMLYQSLHVFFSWEWHLSLSLARSLPELCLKAGLDRVRELEAVRTCSATPPSPSPSQKKKACDHVIAASTARLRELVTGQEVQSTARQIKPGRQQLHSPSSLPCALPDNMDCGIVTSKTVLLFLSLVFWVSHGGACPPADIRQSSWMDEAHSAAVPLPVNHDS